VFCALEKEKNTNVSSECNRQPHVMVLKHKYNSFSGLDDYLMIELLSTNNSVVA